MRAADGHWAEPEPGTHAARAAGNLAVLTGSRQERAALTGRRRRKLPGLPFLEQKGLDQREGSFRSARQWQGHSRAEQKRSATVR